MRRIDPEKLRWAMAPPTSKGPFFKIVSPKAGQRLELGILGDRIHGVWTHYYLKRTRPCVGDQLDCEGCAAKLGRRWKGFLACYDPDKKEQVIAEITAQAARRCIILWEGSDTLRGMTLVLSRPTGGKTGPVWAEVFPRREGAKVPQAFLVVPALMRIWDFEADGVELGLPKGKAAPPSIEEERQEIHNRLF